MRRITLLWFLVATCVGVALFLVKHEVQRRQDQLASLHRSILASQEAIHVLEAEWSYLNRPDRLEALVRRHLDLVPLQNRQFGALETLPMRLPALDDGAALENGMGGDEPTFVRPLVSAASDGISPTPPLPEGRPVVLTGVPRQ